MLGLAPLPALIMSLTLYGGDRLTLPEKSFAEDVAFLREHVEVIVLSGKDGNQIAVVPEYQGRVMTSRCSLSDEASHGWINYEAVSAGEIRAHINVFGGEDRFWMGPEGGQYSIFFASEAEFTLENWQTPPCIDSVAWNVASKNESEVRFRHEAHLQNFSSSEFSVRIDRTVRLLEESDIARLFSIEIPEGCGYVAFETENTITNLGETPWTADTGLLSIWILGMLKPSPDTFVVIPFKSGDEAELGPIVNDSYFGKVPGDRLKVHDDVLLFRGDGKYRSKIGLTPHRALDRAGSVDAVRGVVTLIQYKKPKGATQYVNSMWEIQEHPYGGDALNSYNDGPPAPGEKPLGPFYELESSSPAAALKPGESLTHFHRTVHISGSIEGLDQVTKSAFGIESAEIVSAFK